MKTILVFGNELVREDSLAKEISREIRMPGVRFVQCLSPEEILNYKDDTICILDVVKGIDKVEVIDDLEILKSRKLCSAHDLDLSFFLKIMKKHGMLRSKVRIIGVPMDGDRAKTKKQLTDFLKKDLLDEN
ncbi:hypothetical protein GF351_04295 [Candidatus Woesearchaeota archaeon]|nr:hypothetical protein [Candidatus Woesearchaeota archaeon]